MFKPQNYCVAPMCSCGKKSQVNHIYRGSFLQIIHGQNSDVFGYLSYLIAGAVMTKTGNKVKSKYSSL